MGTVQNVERQRPHVPARTLDTDFPLIDSDPYARSSDYAVGAATAAAGPAFMLLWERLSPSYVGKGGFAPIMRLVGVIGITGGFLQFYNRSIFRFYGFTENQRERDMDMREMVDKVKRSEPLYGKSSLTPYMQGVASRNSRYAGVWLHIIPWLNFVNHDQHGVDTAKYYQQAERELEAERTKAL
ncbi:MAG: hypothetical protein LQ338_003158 [Usnochroma carphineum]|nr:MAG: hypothetical protein LQ338_003158 [Usnochroma carphineum]